MVITVVAAPGVTMVVVRGVTTVADGVIMVVAGAITAVAGVIMAMVIGAIMDTVGVITSDIADGINITDIFVEVVTVVTGTMARNFVTEIVVGIL